MKNLNNWVQKKNYITLDEDIYDISYLNKVLKGGEVNNINILSENGY